MKIIHEYFGTLITTVTCDCGIVYRISRGYRALWSCSCGEIFYITPEGTVWDSESMQVAGFVTSIIQAKQGEL